MSLTASNAAAFSETPRRAPLTARRSAASFPGWELCPLTHSNKVFTFSSLRSSIFDRMDSTKSLLSTGLLPAVIQLLRRHFVNHTVTQLIAYWLSVNMVTSRCRGAMSSARRMAVSSAR
ncbi:hypothetical protein BDQ94DRAFT_804 [Aspergillus welwitschiae]|uniref:Uncharacterized protein n=1 Tax=Aspergillus welwitschiae TaxID=1341132 RepID=A0A3F3QJI3_9EURO|nr:hypothetical protein BDQ94DRAFT_804 [Aspergillus welwitschiae]RDH39012.1 hypothetical protein BDQ94DRAFT_804 [Aspergillus welwitschiae]